MINNKYSNLILSVFYIFKKNMLKINTFFLQVNKMIIPCIQLVNFPNKRPYIFNLFHSIIHTKL